MIRQAFTLLEVMATLLLVTVGLTAVAGLMLTGMRSNDAARASATGMATALTVLADPAPLGLSADLSDADGDGWTCDSTLVSARAYGASGTQAFTVSGSINGYWVRRTETSSVADVVDQRARWATVTVDVYNGQSGHKAASLKRRLLRSW